MVSRPRLFGSSFRVLACRPIIQSFCALFAPGLVCFSHDVPISRLSSVPGSRFWSDILDASSRIATPQGSKAQGTFVDEFPYQRLSGVKDASVGVISRLLNLNVTQERAASY